MPNFNEHQNSPAWQKQRIQKSLERLRAKNPDKNLWAEVEKIGGQVRIAEDSELPSIEQAVHDLESRY